MSNTIESFVCPSILSADFACLGAEAQRLEKAGADRIHVDVMDGQFVPNLTFGPQVVASLNKSTSLFLDVHLMMYNPFEYIEKFVSAGADQLTFHIEATEDVEDTIAFIKRCSCKAGLSINPETSAELLIPYFSGIDQVTIMSVHPGFGGQNFIPETLDKIAYIRSARDSMKCKFDIAVDGGVDRSLALQCAEQGANVFVSGTYLFSTLDMKQEIALIRDQTLNILRNGRS